MQLTKFRVLGNNESYRKFFTALELKEIPTISKNLNNGVFEVNSVYAPTIVELSRLIEIKIEFLGINAETLGDDQYYGTVRHAIEFYGLTPVIPQALYSFPGFQYNPDKARVSFIVANGTSMQKGIIVKTIYSTDPKIQEFNRIFSAANQKIDWNKIKTYDFAVSESQPAIPPTPKPIVNPNPLPTPKPPVTPTQPVSPNYPPSPTDKPDEGNGLLFAAIGIGLVVAFSRKKGKRKK